MLEPVARKRAWPVLRGLRRGNAPELPDERWFGFLTDQLLRRGVHKSVAALEKDVREWIKGWNEDPKPFVWKKTAEEILDSLARYISRISGA
ncbi:hypothetical protein [Saccharopolyspora pogona]|uniref:hypothetical protein n=1 Tax=Saccharopolyspora pogona TaxID=333966 RepID=UPI001CC2361D|nr:hypothetical protein [Saccharopolyspora pogona]